MHKVGITAAVAVIFVAVSVLWLYAQKPDGPEFELGNPEYRALAKKFDALAQEVRDLKKTDADIARKLDQALINQQKILEELAVVKVRATRK